MIAYTQANITHTHTHTHTEEDNTRVIEMVNLNNEIIFLFSFCLFTYSNLLRMNTFF